MPGDRALWIWQSWGGIQQLLARATSPRSPASSVTLFAWPAATWCAAKRRGAVRKPSHSPAVSSFLTTWTAIPIPFPFHIIPMASHGLSMHFPCTSHALPFSIIFPYCLGFLLEGPHGSAGPIAHHCLTSLEIQQTLLAFWFHVFMPCLRE